MIIQRLVELHRRLESDSTTDIAVPGFSSERIGFAILLEPDGGVDVEDLRDENGRSRIVRVPHIGERRTINERSSFLWDTSEYVLAVDAEGKTSARQLRRFALFRDLHLTLQPRIDTADFDLLCKFLLNWNPDRIENLRYRPDIFGAKFVFRIAGQREFPFLHDSPACRTAWLQYLADRDSGDGQSLSSGSHAAIARLHPAIKGVHDPRGQAEKGIVSFNKPAFESYGKTQSFNAPVSIDEAARYALALNYLLARPDRRIQLGDATVVFWAGAPTLLEEVASDLFGDAPPPPEDAPAEDRRRADQVRLFLSQLQQGDAAAEAIKADDSTPFYILGLSPNASRLSVRFWHETTVGQMRERLAQYIRETELVGARENDPPPMVRRIVHATGRALTDPSGRLKGYDSDAVSPLLAGAVARAVFTGGRYPQSLLGAMLNRLRADGVISHVRVAAIKACLIRNSRLAPHPKEVPVALNPEHPEASYHCGRLLALLDYTQSLAIHNVNAGIARKYFGSASSQPGAILPRVVKTTVQGHIPKLDVGVRSFVDRRLQQIMGRIDQHFPRILNIEGQGLFTLGFYHERAELPSTPPQYSIVTERGDRVRSKSEALIANILFSMGIDYEYEPELPIEGRRPLRPDFKISNDVPSGCIYIEHLGMLEDSKYRSRWEVKLQAYRDAGLLPADEGGGPLGQLLIFQESREQGLDTSQIRAKITSSLTMPEE